MKIPFLRKVPKWIKTSEIYKNMEEYDFSSYDEDKIPIYEMKIENMKDFKNILKTIKF